MKPILFILFMVYCCFAEGAEFSPLEESFKINSTSDRKSDEAEGFRVIREQLTTAGIEWKNKDLSVYSTDELLNMALTFQPGPASAHINEELEKRSEEIRAILLKKLESPLIRYDVLYRIPFIAGIVDTEFQVEIAKRCLFREDMKEADIALRITEDTGEGIYSLIAQSKNDETAVLDRLISEGRLEKGSEFDLKWRKQLAKKNVIRQVKDPRSQQSIRLYADKSDGINEGSQVGIEGDGSRIEWDLIAILLAVLICLLLAYVMLKRILSSRE